VLTMVVIRNNPSPDQAKRFSSLFTKLLSQNVLTKKWAVLKFLMELSNSQDGAAGTPEPVLPVPASSELQDESEEVFSRAFGYQGLHRLPVRDAPQSSWDAGYTGEQRADESGRRTNADILAERNDGIGIFGLFS
jgi:gamma-tubulin complex component 3